MAKSVFSVEKPEESAGFLLWQTTLIWQRLIRRALDPFDVSHAHFVILAILLWFEKTGQKPSQVTIVNWSKLDKMTVSNSLKYLSEQGCISRVESDQDTRSKQVDLTKKGRDLALKLVPIVERIDHSFFGVINETDQKNLTHLLNQVIKGQVES